MAEEFELKYVGLVATIIGATVLAVGLLGIAYNIFIA